MIIKVKKYLFVGAKKELNYFFEKAQEKGFIEFIPSKERKSHNRAPDIDQLIQAVKILRKQPVLEEQEDIQDYHLAIQTSRKVISIYDSLARLEEKERVLEAEIARVLPYGNFPYKDLSFIEQAGKRFIQFFCMKTEKVHKTNLADELIYINTAYDLDYFISINSKLKSYPEMIEIHIEKPVGELKEDLILTKEKIKLLELELKQLAAFHSSLQKTLIEALNLDALKKAKSSVDFPTSGSIFSIEAWIPKNHIDDVIALTRKMGVIAERVAKEKTDKVPTYMENKGFHRVGEDLVHIYDTPAITDKDPSGWVLGTFILFFAIIVADGGYGALYLSIALLLKIFVKNPKDQVKRLLKLTAFLGTSCIVWGLLTSSFFGITIAPSSFLGKISVLRMAVEKKADYHMRMQDDVYLEYTTRYIDLKKAEDRFQFTQYSQEQNGRKKYVVTEDFSDNILLEFALLLGIVHLSIAFIRNMKRNLSGIGWIIFMVGGYLYAPLFLEAATLVNYLGGLNKELGYQIGQQLVFGGIALALILAIIQQGVRGIAEITNVVGIFGDVLSYLRLYALALASGLLARTFNDIGLEVGLAVGVLIIIVGHAQNLLLSAMGGVIHGLRLNFLEWYRYCFEGGGRLFKPLRKMKI